MHKESKRLLLFDPRGDELWQFAPDAGSPGSPTLINSRRGCFYSR